jgi:hypothetical protein
MLACVLRHAACVLVLPQCHSGTASSTSRRVSVPPVAASAGCLSVFCLGLVSLVTYLGRQIV